MKLFWKIFSAVFISFLLVAIAVAYVVTALRISDAKAHILEENRIGVNFIAKSIELGYAKSEWPFEGLEKLSERKDFLFWWVVRDDGVIHLADKASFMGTDAYEYFPQLKNATWDKDTLLDYKRNYGIFVKFLEIGQKKWLFCLGFSLREIFQKAKTVILLTIAIFFLSLTLLGAMLYFSITHFIKPIEGLTKGAESIGKGELAHRVKIESQDELGQLAVSFNKMVEDLQKTTVSRNELAKEIEERKRAQEELISIKQLLENVTQGITDGLLLLSNDYKILWANNAILELSGLRKEEIIGNYCYRVTHRQKNPCSFSGCICPSEECAKTGMPVTAVHAHIDKNGNHIFIEVSCYPVKNKDGEVIQFVHVYKDISERRKTEAELERLASFPELNPDPIVEIDFSHNIYYMNPAAKQMMPDLKDNGPNHLFLADLQNIFSIFKSGEKEIFLREIKIKDAWFQQLFSYLPQPQRIRIYAADITERKKIEDALRASESKYRTLTENLPQKVFLKDKNSVYVSCNDSYVRDLKIKPEEITGKTDYDFYPQGLAEKYRSDDKRIMESGKTEEIEEKYVNDGQEFIVFTVKTPIRDQNGNIAGILGIFWDITERKKMEEQIKAYTKKTEEINRELDDFTYIVSHDLKEPLRSIDAFSKFALDDYKDRLDEEGRNYLERIRVNSTRMQNLIEDLLEISRIEKKKNPLEEVSVSDLISEAKLRLEYAIKEKNAEIVIQDNLPRIFCDRIRLVEVFVNLISNAIKFNDKQNPRIEVGCSTKDDRYEFYVKDDGPGIEQQYYEKIFEIFQRLGKREDHEGTGAGLTIVKKIIEMHKGKIWVESKVGEYATFYFTIPKKKEAILDKKKLGEILVEKKLLTEEELKKALKEQGEIG